MTYFEANRIEGVVRERSIINGFSGRAVALAVSGRFHITAARVRGRVRLCGVCGGQWHGGSFFSSTSVSPATHSLY
jgi:hypothetical protein